MMQAQRGNDVLKQEVQASSVEEVEQALKRHADLESSVAAKGDAFSRLEKLTAMEIEAQSTHSSSP
jgi:hypothetical protein